MCRHALPASPRAPCIIKFSTARARRAAMPLGNARAAGNHHPRKRIDFALRLDDAGIAGTFSGSAGQSPPPSDPAHRGGFSNPRRAGSPQHVCLHLWIFRLRRRRRRACDQPGPLEKLSRLGPAQFRAQLHRRLAPRFYFWRRLRLAAAIDKEKAPVRRHHSRSAHLFALQGGRRVSKRKRTTGNWPPPRCRY